MANTIYKVQVTNNINDEHEKNLGAAETSFKERYSNHTWDFKHKKQMKSVYLEFISKYKHEYNLLCNVKRNDNMN